MHVYLNINCVFDQVQNQYMKEIVKHSIENLVNNEKKNHKKNNNNLTVFEPKAPLRGTDAIPLSQTATFNIKCLKWDLKDSLICLDLAYIQPQNNLFGISGSSVHFFN